MSTETTNTAEEFFSTPAPTPAEYDANARAAAAVTELANLQRRIITAAIAKSGYFADECAGMTVDEAMEILSK